MATVLRRVFYAAFALCFTALLIAVISAWQGNGPATLLLAAAFAAAGLLAALFFKARVDAMRPKRFRLLLLLLLAGYGVLMAAAYFLLAYHPIMDLKVVYEAVPDFLNGTLSSSPFNHYFIVCNNNVGLLLVLGAVFALLSPFGIRPLTQGGLAAAGLANTLAIVLAVWFLLCCARRLLKSNSGVLLTFALAAGCAAFYLWAPYFYTDTLSMPFVTGGLLLYLKAREAAGFGRRAALVLLSAAVLFAGFAVKGSVAALPVAIAVHLLLEHRDGILRALALALAACAAFALLYAGYAAWQRLSGVINFSTEREVGLPLELWFLYGSHGSGGYSEDDLQYCIGFIGLENRRAAVRGRLYENYAAYGPADYAALLARKGAYLMGDGKYGADDFTMNALRSNFTHSFLMRGQPLYRPFGYLCQAVHYAVLALFAAALWRRAFLRQNGGLTALYLMVFGTLLFFCFWEVAPRYALNTAPLLLLGAADGLTLLYGGVSKLAARIRSGLPRLVP